MQPLYNRMEASTGLPAYYRRKISESAGIMQNYISDFVPIKESVFYYAAMREILSTHPRPEALKMYESMICELPMANPFYIPFIESLELAKVLAEVGSVPPSVSIDSTISSGRPTGSNNVQPGAMVTAGLHGSASLGAAGVCFK